MEVSWQILLLAGFVVFLMGVFAGFELIEGAERGRLARAKDKLIGRLR